jgi:hypothetical protein
MKKRTGNMTKPNTLKIVSKIRIVVSLTLWCLGLGLPQGGRCDTLSEDGLWIGYGQLRLPMTSLEGTWSGIMVDLGSGPQPSGLIHFSLEGTKSSTTIFDFDTSVITYDMNLLLTFPLQQSLMLDPVSLHLVETGPLPVFNLFLSPIPTSGFELSHHDAMIAQPLMEAQPTSGSGTGEWNMVVDSSTVWLTFGEATLSAAPAVVDSGPFAGFRYENCGGSEPISVNTPGEVAHDPTGGCGFSNTPEPSSALLLVGGACVLAGQRFVKSRRPRS